jgi:hypothetical protein
MERSAARGVMMALEISVMANAFQIVPIAVVVMTLVIGLLASATIADD